MLAGFKLSIGFVVCAVMLCLVNQGMNGDEPKNVTAIAEAQSSYGNSESEESAAGAAPERVDSFAAMRAALSVAKQKANELESYTAVMEMQGGSERPIEACLKHNVQVATTAV